MSRIERKYCLISTLHCRDYLTFCYIASVFRYNALIHLIVHGHMTYNNETVSSQMANAKREMLTAVSRDQGWPDVVAEISARYSVFLSTSSWETKFTVPLRISH